MTYLHEDNHTSPIGGREFITQNPGTALPFLIIMSLASLIGTTGNFLVMLCILFYKPLCHHRNIFLFNLALSDFMVTSIGDPYSIIGN